MRVLIISDIHANLSALEAVLEEAGEFDAAWCLGDLVGYGPDPNECIERVRSLPNLSCIIGNHDLAALDLLDPEAFNPEARAAVLWTQRAITPSSAEYLKQLPTTIGKGNVTLVHGSPRHPVWEYLLDAQTAGLNFAYFPTQFCIVGHTHLPNLFTLKKKNRAVEQQIPTPNAAIKLSVRTILNPGSVGQPRDRDPRCLVRDF